MHRVLRIPELVLEIVSWIELDYHKLDFALTCKDIFAQAISEIWRYTDVYALCCIIPKAPLTPADYPKGLRLSQTLKKHEWDPLLYYGRHIRALYITDKPCTPSRFKGIPPVLLASTIIGAYQYYDKEPLFPQLKTVFIDLTQAICIAPCITFITRPLEDIRISISSHIQPIIVSSLTILTDAIQQSTRVRNFSLLTEFDMDASSKVSSDGLEYSVAALISQLPSLKSLTLPWEGSERSSLFLYAATIPVLQRLRIEEYSFRPCRLHTGSFPNLKVLSLGYTKHYTLTLDSTVLLETISSNSLEEFELTSGGCHVSVVRETARVLALRWSSTLRKIALHMTIEDGDELDREYDLRFNIIAPLLKCKRLQYLAIQGPRDVVIRDEDCDAMSLAWPGLRGLWITLAWDGDLNLEWVPVVTRRSLALLSARCQALLYLSISVNLEEAGQPLPVKGLPFCSPLLHLNLDHSTCGLEEARNVVDFLRTMFPKMGIVGHYPHWDAAVEEVADCLNLSDADGCLRPDELHITVDPPFMSTAF